MARPVDEKIVRMSLDNDKFKRDVTDTLKSFQSINETINSNKAIDLSRIADAVEGIKGKFSGLGIAAATVISDITRKAIDMGNTLWKSIVDPINEGGRRRAMNIEKAQFQFQGLGMDVEAAMKSANDAVLGTAFGLDEAAVVAAQFGATGMEAGEKMTSALRGISGVAAMTGSSYSDIGQIFTVVAGNGRLMSNELLRLSSRGINAAATLADQFGMTEQEVRKLVTEGGVSFEMFATAMSDAFGEHATRANETYTGSLSNMRAALSRIGAKVHTPRLENMRDLFNSLTPVINELNAGLDPLIDRLNEISTNVVRGLIKSIENIDLSTFIEMGGMKILLEAFNNVILGTKRILYALREGFKRAFPNSTLSMVMRLTGVIRDVTSSMILSGDSVEKLANIIHGLISVFDTAWVIASSLAEAIFGIIPPGTGGGVLGFISMIADLAIALNESVREGNILTRAIDKLGNAFKTIGTYLLDPMALLERLSELIRVDLVGAFNYMKDKLTPIFNWLGDTLGKIWSWFKEAFSGWGGDELLGGGFLVIVILLIQKIKDIVSNFSEGITGPIGGFFNQLKQSVQEMTGAFTGVFEQLGDALKSFQERVKYKNLLTIAIAVGILAISLKILEGISVADIAKGLASLVGSMILLSLGMMAISKIKMKGTFRSSVTLIALAISVTIMASALKKVGELSLAEIGKGLLALAGILVLVTTSMAVLSKVGGKIGTSSLQLIALATSILILTSAVRTLSEIEDAALIKGIAGLGGIILAISGFMILVNGAKIGPGTAIGLIGTATAIQIIVSAVERIGSIDTGSLIKGLSSIAVILLELAVFSKLAGNGQALMAGTAISMMAAALTLMIIPITKMGNMSWEELVKGLGGMALALAAVAAVAALASSSLLGAAGILVMAVALTALMVPIGMFSVMSWETMIKGLVGLTASMVVVAGAALLLSPAAGAMLAFGAALLVVGVAVAAIGAGVALFGVGLVSLGTLTATTVAAIVNSLRLLIRGLTGLLIDVHEFLIELGMTFLSAVAQIGPKMIETASILITKLVRVITEKVPEFAIMGADMLIELMKGIEDKGPELIMQATDTILALIIGMADALEENGEAIVNAFVRLMGEVIIVVIEAGVATVNALFGWLPGVEEATASIGDTAEKYIRDNFGAEQVAKEKGEGFASSLEGTSERAREAGSKVGSSGREGLEGVDYYSAGESKGLEGVDGLGSDKVLHASEEAGRAGGEVFGEGYDSVDFKQYGEDGTLEVAEGAVSSRGRGGIKEAAETISTEMSDTLLTRGGTMMKSSGETVTIEAVKGLSSGRSINMVKKAAIDVGKTAKDGLESVKTKSTGENFSKGFGDGISVQESYVRRKATSIGRAALSAVNNYLAIRSPSRKAREQGGFFGEGLALGISDKVKSVASSAKDMAVTASKALRNALLPIVPDEEEMTIRLLLDDNDIDWDALSGRPIPMRPDPSFVNAMAEATRNNNRQNGNKTLRENTPETKEVHYHEYTIGVTAGGNMSKDQVRKLAKDIQREIKNEDDKFRMSRGERVVF